MRYWYAGSQAYGSTFIIPPARLTTDVVFLSFMEGKQFNYIMVEADIHLRLLPTSILDKQSVSGVGMLSQGHMGAPFYIVPKAKLAPDFGILGPLWEM